MIAILGGKGFLGSALTRYCAARGWEHLCVDVDNYGRHVGESFDVLINADGCSMKFLSRERPLEDFDLNVRSVRASLEDFRFGTYVLFSSADVYPDSSSPATTREDAPLDPARQTPYGFHKYLAEQCVRHRAKQALVLRLSGFVGPGLRKNAVYDVLNGAPLWVDPASEFQYLHTEDLARIVLDLASRTELPAPILNIGAAGVISVSEVARLAGKSLRVRSGSPRVRCELSLEKLARFCALPETAPAIARFLAERTNA